MQAGMRAHGAQVLALLGLLGVAVVGCVCVALFLYMSSRLRASHEAARALLAKKKVRMVLSSTVQETVKTCTLGHDSAASVLSSVCSLKWTLTRRLLPLQAEVSVVAPRAMPCSLAY